MEQSKMNKKFVKILAVILITLFMIMAMGYAGSAMWEDGKFFGGIAYALMPLFAYLGIRTAKKLHDEE